MACAIDMPSSSSQLMISGADRGAPAVGAVLEKIGRTTGRTRGPVTQSCADIRVAGTNMVMLCQHEVAAASGPGDSGSPVFRTRGDGTVELAGLVWGGPDDNSTFVFSGLREVEAELGAFDYHE